MPPTLGVAKNSTFIVVCAQPVIAMLLKVAIPAEKETDVVPTTAIELPAPIVAVAEPEDATPVSTVLFSASMTLITIALVVTPTRTTEGSWTMAMPVAVP